MGVTAKKIIQGQLDFSCDDDYRLQQALKQAFWTHRDDDGWVTIGIKPDTWSQYHVKFEELLEKLTRFMGVENVYISQNSFYVPKRTIFTIRKINALFVDLDFHHISSLKDLTPEQIVMMLEVDAYEDIPRPNFILSTGEGLALIWILEPVPIKALPLWQACERWFITQLMEYGADPSACDVARVLRVAGTRNSGNGALARIIKVYDIDNEYTLRQIQHDYLPPLQPFGRKKRRTKSTDDKISKLFNIYSLHWARTEDLHILQALRANAGRKAEGMREIMCFLFRYWMACFTSNTYQSLDATLEFNEKFLDPLSENEVKKATKSAEKGWRDWLDNFDENGNLVRKTGKKLKGYNYRNSTIIELLQITPDEQRHMNTIISQSEKQRRDTEASRAARRNSDGLTNRQATKQHKIQEVARMIAEGIKPKEIAEILSCSTRYVYSLIKVVN